MAMHIAHDAIVLGLPTSVAWENPELFGNIGGLTLRILFSGPFYYEYNKEPPK